MDINFIGLGKLGLPLATLFASNNIKVNAIDINKSLINILKAGQVPWLEYGLENYIRDNFEKIIFTDNYSGCENYNISIILVNTPSDSSDGSFSNRYIEDVLSELSSRISKGHLFILSSTVMPGTIKNSLIPIIEKISNLSYSKKEFSIAYVPDFVALGSVINDFQYPDFVVIGADEEEIFEKVKNLYKNIIKNDCPIIFRKIEETELIKVALNAFITTKISFANFLGILANRISADINSSNLTNVIGLDKRIGTRYFNPGTSYGGTCFPRDTWAFIKTAETVGLRADQMYANENINDLVDNELLERIINTKKRKVILLGASFKPNSSVVTLSLSSKLIPKLLLNNFDITVYDESQETLDNLMKIYPNSKIRYTNSLKEFDDDSVFILTMPSPIFKKIEYGENIIIDPWNFLKKI